MSTTTGNIGLFKYDVLTDGGQAFNINQSLNQNWDILDSEIGTIKNSKTEIITYNGSGTYNIANDKIYYITPTNNLIILLPNSYEMQNEQFGQILVVLQMNDTYTFKVGTSYKFIGVNEDVQEITTGKYTLYYEYNYLDQRWICGIIKQKETGE